MTDKKPVQIESQVDPTGAKKGFDEIKQSGRDMASSVSQSSQTAAKGVDSIGQGADASAQKVQKSSTSIVDSIKKVGAAGDAAGGKGGTGFKKLGDDADEAAKKVARATRDMQASLERALARAQAGDGGQASYIEQLAKGRGADLRILQPYIEQLRQVEAAQKAANGSLNTMGVTARQTAAALRGVPAQFTDIVTALQGGQAPLTVFLQQGGQLKDMFGGAGAAAKALGGYVAGLINPFTLAAAAAGALGYGLYAGAEEGQAFNRTLILTGNAAGLTASQLSSMAAAVEKLGGGTQGRAAEVLNELVNAGVRGRQALTQMADAALRLERVGGPAAEETAKAFASLSKAPLEGAIKLNEATNFLSRSVYEQIRALEQQGRIAEASAVAQNAYYETAMSRSAELEKNLGALERAWIGIKDAAKGAGDAIKGIGRNDLDSQIDAMRSKLALAESIAKGGGSGTGLFAVLGDKWVQSIREQLRGLEQIKGAQEEVARMAAKGAEATKQKAAWDKESTQYLTNSLKLQREIEAVEKQGLASGIARKEIEDRIAAIREKYDTGASVAAIRGVEQQRLEAVKRGIESINFLRETGHINERTQIEEITRLELTALQAQRNATAALLSDAGKKINAEKEVAQLRLQLAQIDGQMVTRRLQGAQSLETALDRQRRATEALTEAEREQNRADQAAYLRSQTEARNRLAISIQNQNLSLKEETELLELEGRLVLQSSKVREATLEYYRIELALKRQIAEIDKADVPGGEEERELLRAEARANAAQARRNAVRRAEIGEWQSFFTDIERGLTDSLFRATEQGGKFFDNLISGIKNTLKTAALKLVINVTMQQGANLLNSLLGGGSGGGLLGGLGGLGGMGDMLGLGGLSKSLFGELGSGAGTILGGVSGTAAAGGAMSGASSLMGGLGGAMPWVAGFLALGSLAKSLDHSGTPHIGGSSAFNATTGLALGQGLNGVGSRQYDYSQQTETFTTGIVQSVVGILDSTAAAFGRQAGFSAAAAFADDSSKDGAWGAFSITRNGQMVSGFGAEGNGRWPGRGFADGEAGSQQYLTNVATDVRRALDAIGLPAWATSMLDKLGAAPSIEQLGTTVANINAIQAALAGLGAALPQIAGLSGEAVNSLITAMGGIQGLTQAASSYYDNFYTENERRGRATEQLNAEFAKLGMAVPTSREAFRALVEAQDETTEAGLQTWAALIKLNPAFAALVPATEALGDSANQTAADVRRAAEQMAEAGRRALAGLADERGSLQAQLLRAGGDAAGAASLERQQALVKLTEGLSAADAAAVAAAYDYNTVLREQIKAIEDAEAAMSGQAERERARAAERASLEQQLLQLDGNTAELRRRQLEQLEPLNRALQEEYFRRQDQIAAAQEAAAALQAVNDALSGLADARFDLENELLGLQGNEAEVARRTRERDLARLTAGMSEADVERITAAYDYNLALREQKRAAEEAARQTEEAARQNAALAQAAEDMARRVGDVLDDLASARFETENEMLSLQGNDAEIARRTRERDLARLTKDMSAVDAARITAAYDYNVALREQLRQQQAAQAEFESQAQAQADAQAEAARQSAAAAEEFREAMQSVADAIFDEVGRIRGLVDVDGADSFATVQAKFSVATAQARAGDKSAAERLPELSRTLLELAAGQATTLAELQSIRARTAGSLEATGNALQGYAGGASPASAAAVLTMSGGAVAVQPPSYSNVAPVTPAGLDISALLEEVRGLRRQVTTLLEAAEATKEAAEGTKNLLNTVTEGGRAMQTEAAS